MSFWNGQSKLRYRSPIRELYDLYYKIRNNLLFIVISFLNVYLVLTDITFNYQKLITVSINTLVLRDPL